MLKLVFIYLFIYCLSFFQQSSIPQLTQQIPTITFCIKTSAKLPDSLDHEYTKVGGTVSELDGQSWLSMGW